MVRKLYVQEDKVIVFRVRGPFHFASAVDRSEYDIIDVDCLRFVLEIIVRTAGY